LGIDVLVMGTVCRAGIPGFIIGNTAERVLDAVDCSVLVVKPEGFVSPVAPLISGEGGK
jgi:nucleotide-binding universal stress UspA family protein